MSMTTISSPRWTRSGIKRRPINPVPPATKVVMAFRQRQRFLRGAVEMLLDFLPGDAPAQEIRPQKLAERGRILGVTARSPEFTGERAVGVINELVDRARDILI